MRSRAIRAKFKKAKDNIVMWNPSGHLNSLDWLYLDEQGVAEDRRESMIRWTRSFT
uniref:Uncharacterized protein n=1 Tax=Tetranychus urticae TaxID=32264 RepID=T1KD53_TETUR